MARRSGRKHLLFFVREEEITSTRSPSTVGFAATPEGYAVKVVVSLARRRAGDEVYKSLFVTMVN